MDTQMIKKMLKEINKGFIYNKKIIFKAIENEFEEGYTFDYDTLISILYKYEKLVENDIKHELKRKAVVCSGNPEITLTVMLDAISYNNNVVISCSGYKIINEVMYTIISESIKELNLKNNWIDYNETYNELYIKNNQKKYDEILFVGDYFEFKNFKYYINTKLQYNNFEYIKLYLNKNKNLNEYKTIMKYAYIKNIYVEVYEDLEEFIIDSTENDFGVAYVSEEEITKLKGKSKFKDLLINEYPFTNYRFKLR